MFVTRKRFDWELERRDKHLEAVKQFYDREIRELREQITALHEHLKVRPVRLPERLELRKL